MTRGETMRKRPFDEDFFDIFDAFTRRFFRGFRDFEDFFEDESGMSSRNIVYDITEDENNVYVSIELPGVEKEDIDLRVDPDAIELKVESKKESSEEKEGFRSSRRSFFKIYRRFTLPVEVDPDKAKATYKNGVLEIVAPKVSERGKKKINIE